MPVFETFDDIIPSYKFLVEIPGFGSVNFSAVEGMGFTHRVQKYISGGTFQSAELYLGTDYHDVTLRRGMSRSAQLYDWANHAVAIYDEYSQQTEFGHQSKQQSVVLPHTYKVDVTISQLSVAGIVMKKWVLTEAWVKGYNISNLDASRSELSFESITLSCSGILSDFAVDTTSLAGILV